MTYNYNDDFAKILDELADIMMRTGEAFKAKQYLRARDSIYAFPEKITDVSQIKSLPGFSNGKGAIYKKLEKYYNSPEKDRELPSLLLRMRKDPLNLFTKIYGIGPSKAKQLIEKNEIETIENLKNKMTSNPSLLNNVQKIGLKYYDDLLERIPRSEIEVFQEELRLEFCKMNKPTASFEIVGSYRRGATSSGDIDVIITDSSNNMEVFKTILNQLKDNGIIIETLSEGKTKSLTIGKIKNGKPRRIDFLYSNPIEYPFAVLYFTGSKAFNASMRGYAQTHGLRLNEHGLRKLINNKPETNYLELSIVSEKDIFNYLQLQYVEPIKRIDFRSLKVEKNNLSSHNNEMKNKLNNNIHINSPLIIQPNKKSNDNSSKSKTFKNSKSNVVKSLKNINKNNNNHNNNTNNKSNNNKTIIKDLIESMKNKVNKNTKNQHKNNEINGVNKFTELDKKLITKSKKNSNSIKSNKKNQTRKKKAMTKKQVLAHIQEFQKNGITHIKSLNENEVFQIIGQGRKAYYNNKPIMTDNEFDIIFEYAGKIYPTNEALDEVGAPIEKKDKVQLPYFMGSMDKIKPTSDSLTKWVEKYPGNDGYVISAKLDGVSGLYSTEGGTPKLYTRGNGIVGQDITHLIPYLKLPKDANLTIRGEFIIQKAVFDKLFKDKFSNPRNFVAGIINSKTINKTRLKHIDFIAYEVIVPIKPPQEQMNYLKSLDVDTVLHNSESNITNESLSNYLTSWRNSYNYEIDGIIVTHNKLYERNQGNPDHAFAFKMVLTEQVAEAKVVDVIWSASKDGYLKPKIQIEPIQIGGVTIEYATAFNANFLITNKIGIGAIVRMIRSGDVIPYIESVVQPATAVKMPNEAYYWNETHIDILLQNPEENDEVLLKNITGFFTILGVKQLSKGNVKKMMNSGYNSICRILKLNVADLLNVDGFKEKTANTLHNGIKEKVEHASLAKLMSASNIFGHGFAEKKFDVILKAYPNVLNETMEDSLLKERLLSVPKIADKTASEFIKNIDNFKTFLKDCDLNYKLNQITPSSESKIQIEEINSSHVLFEKKICITGFRDKELIELLQSKYSVEIQTGVNSKSFAVIVKSMDVDNNKVMKAKTLNIPIYTSESFKTKFNL